MPGIPRDACANPLCSFRNAPAEEFLAAMLSRGFASTALRNLFILQSLQACPGSFLECAITQIAK
jgi:hypothetical protein